MSKICGYSCEHNKSGVCQISVCDKRLIISDKTEVQTFTRYIDTTITELQQENKILKENAENNDKVVDKVNWENMLLKKENKQLKAQIEEYQKALDETMSEKIDIQNNWNKLKEFIVKEYYMYLPLETNTKSITILIDKMQEIEGNDSNDSN